MIHVNIIDARWFLLDSERRNEHERKNTSLALRFKGKPRKV